MAGVKNLGVAVLGGAVVGDDIFPLASVDLRPIDRGQWQRLVLRPQRNALTWNDQVRGQPVPQFQINHRCPVTLRNESQILAFPNHMTALRPGRQHVNRR